MDMEIDDGVASPVKRPVAAPRGGKKKRAMDLDSKSEEGASLPWIEKYRPETLDDLISHDDIRGTISRLMDANSLPHLLFYGPPGTGKTSTILACARKIHGAKYKNMILELNASADNGINIIRTKVKDFASSRLLFSTGLKLIILDEADNLSKDAQFALRRVIEKYTSSTRFCIICNYINKIIPALRSRCMKFRFGPIEHEQIIERLSEVCTKEGAVVESGGLEAVARVSSGDMRKCMNTLQSCHMSFGLINEVNVFACVGKPMDKDIKFILDVLLNKTYANAFKAVRDMQVEKGLAVGDIVSAVHELLLQSSMPQDALLFCLDELSALEYRLAFGTQEEIQLGALVGIFQLTKAKIVAHAA